MTINIPPPGESEEVKTLKAEITRLRSRPTSEEMTRLLDNAQTYCDSIDADNDLIVGIFMCRELIGQMAECLRRLAAQSDI